MDSTVPVLQNDHAEKQGPRTPAARLRALLAQDKIITCPGVYDGLTTRLALNAGFECLYMVSNQSHRTPARQCHSR